MPEWTRDLRERLARLHLDPAREAEIVEELAQHLDQRYDELRAGGAGDAGARRQAIAELQEPDALADDMRTLRQAQRTPAMHTAPRLSRLGGLWQDGRYAVRMLRRDTWFTAVATITLALGIGAAGAMFSMVHAVLLRDLPYADPQALVMVWESRPREGVTDNVVSPADFLDWKARQTVFEDIAAQWATPVTLSGADEPERVRAGNVSASFFKVLGVAPAMGRDFRPEEEQAVRNQVVILTHGFWQRRFGGRQDVVGTLLTLDGHRFEVVGVLPASFRFPDESIDVWFPIDFTAAPMRERFNHMLETYARLKPGVTLQLAQQNLDMISLQLQSEVVLQNQGHGAHVIPLRDQLVGDVRTSLLVLMAGVAFLLLIACVNVANLLLARGAARTREVAVRAALGAGRARVVRQFLVECLLLTGLATLLALPLAIWGIAALTSLVPAEIPLLNDAGVNPAVFAFMVTIALTAAALFSVIPAFQTTWSNLARTLRDGAAQRGASRQRLRHTLVVAEIALAFVLLVGAGLMTRTLINLLDVNPGFTSRRVLTLPVAMATPADAADSTPAILLRDLLSGVGAQPGVDSVGLTSHLPMSGADSRIGIAVEGREPEPGEPVRAHWRVVTPGYFTAMQLRLLKGRLPSDDETETRASVAVITQTAAARYWPGLDPIGRRVRILTPEWREIIGVIDDVRHWGPSSAVNPEIYVPAFRAPATLVVRARESAPIGAAALRAHLRKALPDAPLARMRTMDEIRGRAVAFPRFYLVVLGLFGGVALLLAVVGVYGVVSYTVAQSRREIGIRMAMGARGSDVMRLFVGKGIVLTAAGLALGAAGAAALTRVMTTLLFAVTPTDAVTYAAMACVMGGVALVSCSVPARRSARVDPLTALRHD